ncbi:MAG: B12-binding domain-containing radical SAM protein [Candidatus Eisenbacteria bacterium]|nr:B12-binding domain-containing radical SAM protein [Candidatus Eisenbacteria bacterium]
MSTEPLLIHPPPYLYEGSDPFGHIGNIVPIGLLAIAEYLEGRGWEPLLLRLPVVAAIRARARGGVLTSADWDAVLRLALERYPARVIAIQCHWTQYAAGAVEVAERIRRLDPARFLVLGGVHAASLAHALLRECPAIDAVIVGEGETPLDRLLEAHAAACLPESSECRPARLGPIPGVVLRAPGANSAYEILEAGETDWLPREELAPLRFDRSLLEPPLGAQFVGVPIVRGFCPKPCTYCELNNRTLFGRKQTVLDETLDQQLALAGAAGVPLYLPENFIGARPLARLIARLGAAEVKAPIYVDCHPDMLSEAAVDALGALAATGAKLRIWVGLESGSARVRQRAGRVYDAERVFAATDRMLALGLRPVGSFLVGLPDEGPEELRETHDWIERWNARGLIADVFPALAFPGTALHREPDRFGLTLTMQGARDYERLSLGWFAPLSTRPLTHRNGRLDLDQVVRQLLALRLEQRTRLGLPIGQEALSFMGHRAASWSSAGWESALAALDPFWPVGVPRPARPEETQPDA